MSQRRQDRCGDRADRRTPPGIYPLEPDRWRLLWHIIVTVLLLAALASTATWLLLDPARHLPLNRDDMSGHASTGRDSSRSAKLTKTGRETDCFSELRIGFRTRMHIPTGSTRRAIVREERNDALARGTDRAVGFAAATDRCQVAKIALACASFASSVHVIRASGVDCSNFLRDNFFQANVMTTTPSSNTSSAARYSAYADNDADGGVTACSPVKLGRDRAARSRTTQPYGIQ